MIGIVFDLVAPFHQSIGEILMGQLVSIGCDINSYSISERSTRVNTFITTD